MNDTPKISVRRALLNAGLNVFAVDLLAESFLRSPIARHAFDSGKQIKFFFPVVRKDTPGWVGVDITIAAVDKFDDMTATPPTSKGGE